MAREYFYDFSDSTSFSTTLTTAQTLLAQSSHTYTTGDWVFLGAAFIGAGGSTRDSKGDFYNGTTGLQPMAHEAPTAGTNRHHHLFMCKKTYASNTSEVGTTLRYWAEASATAAQASAPRILAVKMGSEDQWASIAAGSDTTHTSTTPSDHLSHTWTVGSSGVYLVCASLVVSTSTLAEYRMYLDVNGADEVILKHIHTDTTTSRHHALCKVMTLSAGSNTIKIQASRGASGTPTITCKTGALFVLRLTDQFFFDYNYTAGPVATSSSVYAQTLQVSSNVSTTNMLVFGYAVSESTSATSIATGMDTIYDDGDTTYNGGSSATPYAANNAQCNTASTLSGCGIGTLICTMQQISSGRYIGLTNVQTSSQTAYRSLLAINLDSFPATTVPRVMLLGVGD